MHIYVYYILGPPLWREEILEFDFIEIRRIKWLHSSVGRQSASRSEGSGIEPRRVLFLNANQDGQLSDPCDGWKHTGGRGKCRKSCVVVWFALPVISR